MKKISAPGFARIAVVVISALALLAGATAAHAATPTVSVISISPGTSVAVGTNVTFAVATAGFVDPYYSLTDSFDDGSLGSVDLNSAGEFSWTPEPNDVGTHTVTITAHDLQGDEATTVVNLTVGGSSSATLSVSSIFPSSTVTSGQTVSFDVTASGFSETPSYTVSDSFTGSTLSTTDINSSGNFAWTPTTSDIGTHTITITGEDPAGDIARDTITIQVTEAAATTPAVVECTTGETYSATTGQACTEFIAPAVTTSVVSPAVPETPVVTTVPADTFTQELTVGSTGSQVTALQELLTAQGDFTASITGYFGTVTQAAVEKFQTAHDIPSIGIVGPDTRTALNALETPTTVVDDSTADTTDAVSTASAPTVAEIQSEVQSIETELTQIESQLSGL